MALFDKRKKELKALRGAVESSPSPAGFVNLVERYVAVADMSSAADVARAAMKRFPESEKVQLAFQNVRRMELQEQIAGLQKKIGQGAAGATEFERLGVIYNQELGNKTKAYEVAREGLTKYTKAAGLHLLCGQIRVERYVDDFLANDFMEARDHLLKAVELSPTTTMARVYLAQLYVQVGLYVEARPIVEQLRAEVTTENVDRLWSQIQEAPESTEEISLETRLSRLEKSRSLEPGSSESLVVAEGGKAESSVQHNMLEAYLDRLEKIDGFKAAGIINAEGEPIALNCRQKDLEPGFNEMIHSVYTASEQASHRMDIGSFVNGEIDTPSGTLSISESGGLVLGILAGEPAKMNQLRKAAEEFAAVTRSP